MGDRNLAAKRVGRRIGVLALCAVVAVAACTRTSERVYFNGVYFKTKAKSASDDRRSFVVRVPKVDRSLDGARAAGDYEGTRYCIENFGTSEIDWVRGPDGQGGTLAIDGNTLTLTGRCQLW
ncbi:hypothetical protein [Roseovarius aestuariivivens]|uniref:hypothetical protein n=1 Tax=Roseovarius aestuariivivens TaxID=1888910 RepID=UPI001FD9DE93|nr:hypothetical protein [Roseovarius aestuariivivens]